MRGSVRPNPKLLKITLSRDQNVSQPIPNCPIPGRVSLLAPRTADFLFITARRIRIARTMPSQDVRLSVCLSVRPSVTRRY